MPKLSIYVIYTSDIQKDNYLTLKVFVKFLQHLDINFKLSNPGWK